MAMLAPPTPAGGPDRLAPTAAVEGSASDSGAPVAARPLKVRQLPQMQNRDGAVVLLAAG